MGNSKLGGGFKKKLSPNMKKENILGYILYNDPEKVEKKKEKEIEVMDEEEESESEENGERREGMEVSKKVSKVNKVFLFNCKFEEVRSFENEVDLLITDIPYNVCNFIIMFIFFLTFIFRSIKIKSMTNFPRRKWRSLQTRQT